jgi:hypothetical protein
MIDERDSPEVIILLPGSVLAEFTDRGLRARVTSVILGFAFGILLATREFGQGTTTSLKFHFLEVRASFDRVDVKVVELPGLVGQAVVKIPGSEIIVVGGKSVGELGRRENSNDGEGGKSERFHDERLRWSRI